MILAVLKTCKISNEFPNTLEQDPTAFRQQVIANYFVVKMVLKWSWVVEGNRKKEEEESVEMKNE